MEDLILRFMLALARNNAVCVGADDDPAWIAKYARKMAEEYLKETK